MPQGDKTDDKSFQFDRLKQNIVYLGVGIGMCGVIWQNYQPTYLPIYLEFY